MTQDLVEHGIAPSSPDQDDWSDFVFAAAMEYSFRGGESDALSVRFEVAAEAVVIAYDRLTSI